MNKPNTIENIKKMRNGEKIKCPKCSGGYIVAVGEPATTSVFRCDGCNKTMIMTKK